jgi:cell division protein FtsN
MLEKYIKELLFDHECIVLPEFGGFITHYVNAEIHPITNKFSPPSKRVAFNEQIRLNDGLLISTIAFHENISMDQATHVLRLFIEKIKTDLKTNNLFEIKDIGKFFYNPENRLEFEPENKINFLERSFGLTELFFKPIDRDQKVMSKADQKQVQQRKAVSNSESKLAAGEKSKPSKDGIKTWMIILPVMLLFGGVGGAYFMNQNNISLSSINPLALFEKGKEQKIIPANSESITPDVNTNPSSNADTLHSLNPFSENEINNSNEEPVRATAITGQSGRYFVVIGSFVNKKNAFKLKHKISLQGTDATIMEPGEKSSFYLVSVADFDNHEEAIKKMRALRGSFGKTIWVKKF